MPPYEDPTYPETDFFQITGYRAHSNGWFNQYDDKPLIDAISRTRTRLFRPGGSDSPVELILGILPSGASYLLMSSEQMFEFTRRHDLRRKSGPWRATQFASLSPIYFTSHDELAAKVATYKQRPRNKNRRERDEVLDNSKANRGYVKTGEHVEHYRANFEQQRTLYRILTRQLAPGKVGLAPLPWDSVRIISLVFGEWSVDNRIRDDRLKNPELVDAGWTEVSFPSFFEELDGFALHLDLPNLKNPNAKRPYFSEVIEDDRAGLYARLRTLLNHNTSEIKVPLIVLVHDEDMARSILSHAGIDVNTWSSGLSNLLPFAPVRNRPRPGAYNPVDLPGPCIVDTQKLVKAVMETPDLGKAGKTVPQSAQVLSMQTDTRTCAGDDSLLQLRIWISMAEGLAIDEQHMQRKLQRPPCAQVLAPPQQEQAPATIAVDPDDVDPNDMQGPAPRPTRADDFSDDDDW